ncbi:MAG: thioesterase [Chloroflexota bacterium]|nr:MAG: thioesterase [Chloroflexota bacterium]
MKEPSSAWILRPKPNDQAGIRLFCFPHAGGSAMVFRSWPQDLPDIVEVCAVELPGRGRRIREEPYTNLRSLVGDLVESMQPFIDRPFALFGHSFGALVGFEAARVLQSQEESPLLLLCVSSAKAPQIYADGASFHNQPDSLLIDEVRRLGGTPAAILENEEMLSAVLPAIRADFDMSETYVYTDAAPLSCPILGLASSADPKVDRESLRAWGEQTSAGFNMEVFPGDHFYILQAQSQVLQFLGRALKQALPLMEEK